MSVRECGGTSFRVFLPLSASALALACVFTHARPQEDEEDEKDEALESQEQGRAPVEDHVDVYQSLVIAYDGHLATASEPSKVT